MAALKGQPKVAPQKGTKLSQVAMGTAHHHNKTGTRQVINVGPLPTPAGEFTYATSAAQNGSVSKAGHPKSQFLGRKGKSTNDRAK